MFHFVDEEKLSETISSFLVGFKIPASNLFYDGFVEATATVLLHVSVAPPLSQT